MPIRPMLSATVEDVHKLRYPLMGSPKLDGIRAIVHNGVLYTRNGKPVPNKQLQKQFGCLTFEGLDGELIMGDPTSKSCFRDTTSAVMSHDGPADVDFHVFDWAAPKYPFSPRLQYALARVANWPGAILVAHRTLQTPAEVIVFEEQCLEQGYEGIMLRDPMGVYKNGRSTLREQGLMKLKRFKDSEAIVIGIEERLRNANEAKVDAFGHIERSTCRAGLEGRGDLGALLVRDVYTRVEFAIGSGFDDALRTKLWAAPPIGKTVKYKYFPTGSKDKPRFPIFLGFREDL